MTVKQMRHPELYKANQNFCHPELDSGSISLIGIDRFRVKHGMTRSVILNVCEESHYS